LGYSLDKSDVSLGKTFHITYYWEAIQNTANNYSAIVAITNEKINNYTFVASKTGRLAFRQDHAFPLDASEWGDAVMVEITL